MLQFEPVIDNTPTLKLAHPGKYCPGSEQPARRREMDWLQCPHCMTWKLNRTRIRLPQHLMEFEKNEVITFQGRKWRVISYIENQMVRIFDPIADETTCAFYNELRPILPKS